jgi:acetylornithine deacetylase/succinyl-diaminopimelate desuccinylase-like protein
MDELLVKLRYYVGDALREIREEDLNAIAGRCGVEISFEAMDNRTLEEGMFREETLGKALEEITQQVITVRARDPQSLSEAIRAIYEMYRSPRTPYSFWGSSPEGEHLARALADETGGGWG